jgi:hypothetical protein
MPVTTDRQGGMQMAAVRIATLSCLLAAGSAFAADKPPCALLTRPEVQAVAGPGAIKTQHVLENLPQVTPKSEVTPIHVCNWGIQETQMAVDLRVVSAPLDPKVLALALGTLGAHGKKNEEAAQQFGDVSCWVESLPQKLFPSATCIGNVKGNVLKVTFRSRTVTPAVQQAKTLFDEAAAAL